MAEGWYLIHASWWFPSRVLLIGTKGQGVGDSAVPVWIEVVVAKITWKAGVCEVPWSLFL